MFGLHPNTFLSPPMSQVMRPLADTFFIVVLANNYSVSFPFCGGGTGGFKSSVSRTLQSPLPPLFSWLPPFCPFSIAKYYAMLRNFPLFLPLPFPLELPPPALSSSASRTPPASYSPGLPPPVPPPHPFGSCHAGYLLSGSIFVSLGEIFSLERRNEK